MPAIRSYEGGDTMCLAVPGRVLTIDDHGELRMATVDFGGARRLICLAYAPDAEVGSFVLVHAGFAISVLDEQAAHETLAMLDAALGTDGEGRS
jgi:hydrogenase expression/formation protein HypC